MSVDGLTREYNWEDIVVLILKDMGLDPGDRQHNKVMYLGAFRPPEHPKDCCMEVTRYELDYSARLKENVRDKI